MKLVLVTGMNKSSACSSFEPTHSCNKKIKIDFLATNEHRTGLVFESGANHYDRHNKFHAERPCRIQKVEEHLKKAKISGDERAIVDRCLVLKSRGGWRGYVGEGNSEQLWLSKVHLPGYMQL